MNKKILFSTIVFSILLTALPVDTLTVNASETEAYSAYLTNREYWIDWTKNIYTEEFPVSHAILDIDQNGTDELIIRGSSIAKDFVSFLVFTVDSATGEITRLPVINADGDESRIYYRHILYSEEQKALTFSHTRTGGSIQEMSYYALENGQLTYTSFATEAEEIEFTALPVSYDWETGSNLMITFDRWYDEGNERAAITALNSQGELLWSYESGSYPGTQLYRIEKIGIHNGIYYFCEDGSIIALDINTGELLWKNDDFGGSPSAVLFHDEKIYVCGYFGPDLIVLSENGETLHRIETFDQNLYWPYDLIVSDDTLYIFCEGGGDNYCGGMLGADVDTMEILETQLFAASLDYSYRSLDMNVVNCNEYVTLRSYNSVSTAEKSKVPLGSSVTYLADVGNGFYKVRYMGLEGYILSEYLSFLQT